MSQRGIKVASAWNVDYKDMLAFYYPGTVLRKDYGKSVEVPKFLFEQLAEKIERIGTK